MWNMTSRVRVSKNELQPLDLHRFTQVMCSGFHGTEIPKSPAPWPRNVAWMTAPEVSVLPWRTTSLWKRIGDMLTSVQGIFRIERNCGNIVLRSLVLYRNSGAIWHQKSWSYQDDQVPTDIQCWLSYIISMSHRLNWKNLWDFAFHKVAPSWAPKTCVVVSWDLIY